MSNHSNILLLISLSLSGCTTSYADPAIRGALFDREVLQIPAEYRGLWAYPLDACGVTRDYGRQIEIGEASVGAMKLRRVMTYSDDTAVMIDLASDDSDSEPVVVLFLELSTNGKYLRVNPSGKTVPTVFRRCPDKK